MYIMLNSMSYSITSSLIAASSHINTMTVIPFMLHEYFSYNFRPVITGDTKRFDIDLDVLNDSGQICFLDVQLFKTCWRTNFFKPLLKRSDAVVAVKKWLKPERVKFARGEP